MAPEDYASRLCDLLLMIVDSRPALTVERKCHALREHSSLTRRARSLDEVANPFPPHAVVARP